MFRNRLLYLLALVATTVFYGFFSARFSEILWYLTLALPWVSLILSLPAMVTVKATLQAPGLVSRGADVQVSVQVRCRFPLPRYKLRLRVQEYPSGKTRGYKHRPFRAQSLTIPLETPHCGLIHYRGRACRVCDYLGLFALPRKWKLEGTTLVAPIPTPPDTLPSLRPLEDSPLQPKPGGGQAEVQELRPYRPGDNLRDLHWKLTAKLDEPMVLEPQEPVQTLACLMVCLPQNPDQRDRVLDEALWMSRWLLDQDHAHQVLWATDQGIENVFLETAQDLPDLQTRLCQSLPPEEGTLPPACPSATWVYRVSSQ